MSPWYSGKYGYLIWGCFWNDQRIEQFSSNMAPQSWAWLYQIALSGPDDLHPSKLIINRFLALFISLEPSNRFHAQSMFWCQTWDFVLISSITYFYFSTFQAKYYMLFFEFCRKSTESYDIFYGFNLMWCLLPFSLSAWHWKNPAWSLS